MKSSTERRAFGLFPQHEALLRASGITPEIAEARGYVSADTKAELGRRGFSPVQRQVPGLLIPVWRVTGERAFDQYRPDTPRLNLSGKPIRYETPPKVRMALDVHLAARAWISDPSRPLFITEGIRKADAAVSRGLCCLALLGVWNWRGTNEDGGLTALADWEAVALKDRQIYIVFDSDVMLKLQVHQALARLKAFLEMRGATVALVYLPAGEGGAKVGLDDFLAAGHSVDDLLSLAMTELHPAAAGDRQAVAPSPASTSCPASAPCPAPGPAGEPAPLALLLNQTRTFIRRYVVLTDAQATAVALWTAHTWVIEAADVTIYLAITSPEKRAGKTRLLETLEMLVPRPLRVANISPSALFRTLADTDGGRVVVLQDEADALFRRDGEHEDLRALFNAGYRRGAVVARCEGEGAKIRVVTYDAFGAKALAAIGDLPDTIADRALAIRMKRRAPEEPITRLRFRDARADAQGLRRSLASWATPAVVEALGKARPGIPEELDDRAADGWELLTAVADLAGGEWPRLAREAAVALHGYDVEDDSRGVRLLTDVRRALDERRTDRLTTEEMLAALKADPEAPWGEWGKAGLTARGLSNLLRPFGIRPQNIRLSDGRIVKGYYAEAFTDAFSRWLSFYPLHPLQVATDAGFGSISDPLHRGSVADAKTDESSHQTQGVADVADRTASTGEDADAPLPQVILVESEEAVLE